MNASLLALVLAAVSAPAIETAKEPGTHLYVRTIPPGAKIILDERPGTTDGLLSVTPGKHRVVVELDGYAPERREVEVPQGRITRVEVSLKPTNDSYDGRSMAEWKRLALHDVSAETRAKAMKALAALGNAGRPDEAFAAITSALAQERNDAVIRAGYIAIGQFGPRATPVLLEGVRSENARTRQYAVSMLGEFWRPSNDREKMAVSNEQVVSALIQATRDPSASVRGEACRALGSPKYSWAGHDYSDKIIPLLIKALGDDNRSDVFVRINGDEWGYSPSSVVYQACRALVMYGEKSEAAVPALIEIVQRTPKPGDSLDKLRSFSEEKRGAIQALGRIGPAAKAALPVLESVQKGNSYREIAEAIERIQGTYRGPGLAASTKQPTGVTSPPPPTAVAAAKQPGAKGPAVGATVPRVPAPAQPAAKAESPAVALVAGQEQADKVEDLVEKALLETDDEFQFDQMPLTDVVDQLHHTMKLNILFDRRALEESSIDPSTQQVTVAMRASRGSAIDFMLSQMGLAWTVRDGAMVITTAQKAQEELSTKVYPIEDLAVRGNHNSLIDIITSTIAPRTWEKGGGPGSIMAVGVPRSARLVVRQTYQVHRQIRRLLATVRAMDADAEAGKTPEPILFYGTLTASPAALQSCRRAVAEPVKEFEFDQIPLVDVVEQVQRAHKVNVIVDRKALEEASIDAATTNVTFSVRGISLGQALSLLLERENLTWVLEGDYVRITTKKSAEERLVVGIYPVGDLAETREGRYSGQIHDSSRLITTITSTIAPQTWGGQRGSILPVDFGKFNGLVILQTDAVHRQIAALLAQLRAKGQTPAGKLVVGPTLATPKPGAADTLDVRMIAKPGTAEVGDNTRRIESAAVGDRVLIEIHVTNWGSQPLTNVRVTATPDPEFRTTFATEGYRKEARELSWTFAALAPGETQQFGMVCQCPEPAAHASLRVNANSQQGIQAERRLSLPIRAKPGSPVLEVKITGPEKATVGDRVSFKVSVANRSQTAATGLTFTDTLDDGLLNDRRPGDRNHIRNTTPGEIGVDPGKSVLLFIDFTVTKAGRLGQTVEVTGNGGLRATAQSYLTAIEPAAKAKNPK